DTKLIAHVLEEIHPKPSLYPNGSQGLVEALATWSDTTFFEPGAGLSMGLNSDIPEPVLEDRKAFFEFMDFDELESAVPHLYGQFLAQVELLERQLQDGRPFVLGSDISGADILFYFPLWMATGNFPQVAGWLTDFKQVQRWQKTMQGVGHGDVTDMNAQDALDIASASDPRAGSGVLRNPGNLVENQEVTVTPTDYGSVPVQGKLIGLNHNRVTIRRQDSRVGWVNVHFPRTGYQVEPA
ncbi:MAG: glutathione S-transferase family protein, partial [Pseudomonadota bacterium]